MKSNGKLPEYTPDPMAWVSPAMQMPPEQKTDFGMVAPIVVASIPTALNIMRGIMKEGDDE